jgi:glycolate oxidase FAD binding subunit
MSVMSNRLSPTTRLVPALREILGPALALDGGPYAVDGVAPGLVGAPESVEQLAAALAAANEQGAAVIPWGAGRHMSLGNVPRRYDIALRTAKLDRVLEYEPADLTLTVEAGLTMGKLQALLAERSQFLPIDAPVDATAGGVFATGASGPSRHAYGLPRDWLIGCRVALADGTIVKAGGRVVKNVAGYDMQKLAVGALGTLGVIVEATFKVAPLPPAQETLLARLPSLEAAAQAVRAADARGLALRAVALREAQGGTLAAFWLAGPGAAVERSARELADLCRDAKTERLQDEASERWWSSLIDVRLLAEGAVSLKASLVPSAVVGFTETLSTLARELSIQSAALCYPTTGLVLVQLAGTPDDTLASFIERARRGAESSGGSLVVTCAPLAVKRRIDVWGEAGSALLLMRRLKEQFDPHGTLNPGRFMGGI